MADQDKNQDQGHRNTVGVTRDMSNIGTEVGIPIDADSEGLAPGEEDVGSLGADFATAGEEGTSQFSRSTQGVNRR